jgi:hypothetical protein
MLNKGKAMRIPRTMKMAGLMAFFQKGFFISELAAFAMAPPAQANRIKTYLSQTNNTVTPMILPWGKLCILLEKRLYFDMKL